MRICDLRQKEVINECDCKRLGFISDIEVDFVSGCIAHIIVPGPGKICGVLGREFEYVIPFQCIIRFGPDIIIVSVKEEDVLVRCER